MQRAPAKAAVLYSPCKQPPPPLLCLGTAHPGLWVGSGPWCFSGGHCGLRSALNLSTRMSSVKGLSQQKEFSSLFKSKMNNDGGIWSGEHAATSGERWQVGNDNPEGPQVS